jgi:hypothetical protein
MQEHFAPYRVPPDNPRRRNRYAISPVVRRHRLTEEETEKFLVELRTPRAANVAGITHRLVVNRSQKASSELAAQS